MITDNDIRNAENIPFSDFAIFCGNIRHANLTLRNDIYYKGRKIYKYQAFQKFESYDNMINNPHVQIKTEKIEL